MNSLSLRKMIKLLFVLLFVSKILGETLQYGNYIPLNNGTYFAANYLLGQHFYIDRPIVVTHLALIDAAVINEGMPFQIALYDYSPNGPTGLLCQASANTASGRNELPVKGTPINPGDYFIMAVFAGYVNISSTPGTGDVYYTSFTEGGNLPDPCPTTSVSSGQVFNYYLIGETDNFGNSGDFGTRYYFNANTLIGQPFAVPKHTTVTHLGIIAGCTGISFKIGLYSSLSGAPNQLLTSGSGVVSGNETLVSVPDLETKEGQYFLMVVYEQDCRIATDTTSNNPTYSMSFSYSNGLPANFTSGQLSYTNSFAINHFLVASSASVPFGFAYAYNTSHSITAGTLFAQPVQVTESITVQSLGLFGRVTGIPFWIGLYSNSNSFPGTLLVSASDNATGYQQPVPVSPTPLSAGTYWIAMGWEATQQVSGDFSDFTHTVYYSSWSYAAGLPTTFPSGATNSTTSFNVNLFLEAQGASASPSPVPSGNASPSSSPSADSSSCHKSFSAAFILCLLMLVSCI